MMFMCTTILYVHSLLTAGWILFFYPINIPLYDVLQYHEHVHIYENKLMRKQKQKGGKVKIIR